MQLPDPTSPLTSLEINPVPTVDDPPPISLDADKPTSLLVTQQTSPNPSAFRVVRASSSTMQDRSVDPINESTLSNKQRKKFRMKAHRDLARASAATKTSRGTKARTINKYVRPATACSVDFDAHNHKHTQFAWTGGKDPFSHQRIFKLDEMVGPQSRFGFTLQCWDGKYVPISLYCVSSCSNQNFTDQRYPLQIMKTV